MQEAGVITAFADRIGEQLSFDRSLAERVRKEVEDHLREAAAAVSSQNISEAERLALARFGEAHEIAVAFAITSLSKTARQVGLAAILIIAGVFAVMKVRLGWYAATQWALSDGARAFGRVVGSIDAFAFWLSAGLGVAAFVYIGSRGIPSTFHAVYRRQVRRFVLLCGAGAAALAVSVVGDGVLTALRLSGTDVSAGVLIPLLSMAIEIACAGILVVYIRAVAWRAGRTAAMANT
jgi:hypothetical protein